MTAAQALKNKNWLILRRMYALQLACLETPATINLQLIQYSACLKSLKGGESNLKWTSRSISYSHNDNVQEMGMAMLQSLSGCRIVTVFYFAVAEACKIDTMLQNSILRGLNQNAMESSFVDPQFIYES